MGDRCGCALCVGVGAEAGGWLIVMQLVLSNMAIKREMIIGKDQFLRISSPHFSALYLRPLIDILSAGLHKEVLLVSLIIVPPGVRQQDITYLDVTF